MYVHDIEADMSVWVCVFAEPASSVLQRALVRNSHALTGLRQTLYLVKGTHSSTCADGWRQGDDVTSRRQMCWAWWPVPANAFHPWPWEAPRSPPPPCRLSCNKDWWKTVIWTDSIWAQVNDLTDVEWAKKTNTLIRYVHRSFSASICKLFYVFYVLTETKSSSRSQWLFCM